MGKMEKNSIKMIILQKKYNFGKILGIFLKILFQKILCEKEVFEKFGSENMGESVKKMVH